MDEGQIWWTEKLIGENIKLGQLWIATYLWCHLIQMTLVALTKLMWLVNKVSAFRLSLCIWKEEIYYENGLSWRMLNNKCLLTCFEGLLPRNQVPIRTFYKLQWNEIINLKIKSTIAEVCNVVCIMLFAIVTEIWKPKENTSQ